MESGAPTLRTLANFLIGTFLGVVVAAVVAVILLDTVGLLHSEIMLVFPMALGFFGFVLIMIFGFALASRKQLFEHAAPMEGAYYDPRELSADTYYKIPVYCPHCKDRIDLMRIHWIDPMTLVCQNCMGKVTAKETESAK